MDTNITQSSWRTLTSGTWEDTFRKLMDIKVEYSGIYTLGIFLPYACVRNIYNNELEFLNLNKINDSKELLSIMTLHITDEFNKKTCLIKLKFSGKFVHQRIKRMPNCFYKWNNKSETITIKKYIATDDVEKIKILAEELLNECRRFKFMYCI